MRIDEELDVFHVNDGVDSDSEEEEDEEDSEEDSESSENGDVVSAPLANQQVIPPTTDFQYDSDNIYSDDNDFTYDKISGLDISNLKVNGSETEISSQERKSKSLLSQKCDMNKSSNSDGFPKLHDLSDQLDQC